MMSQNKVFLTLHHEIMRYDGTAANYIENSNMPLLQRKSVLVSLTMTNLPCCSVSGRFIK